MMAFGQDIDPHAERLKRQQLARQQKQEVEEPEIDRFDECEYNKTSVLVCMR